MTDYYRVMLGKGGKYAQECFDGNYIGADYSIDQDLTHELPDDWRDFNSKFIPIYLANRPGKTKIAAGLACGMLYTFSKGMKVGDVVLSPDGGAIYHAGVVEGEYFYRPGENLPHRRPVRWLDKKIARDEMSEALKNSVNSGMLSNISRYSEEIQQLLGSIEGPPLIPRDIEVEDPYAFAMEKHLEDFLVANWSHTALGRDYELFKEDNEVIGRQFQTDTGPIDILAISKDQRTLLVVELKKGRGNDVVVGQLLRYMGYVKEQLAEENQLVKGIIIAMEDDQRMRRALSMVPNIEFYRYEVSFKLIKG